MHILIGTCLSLLQSGMATFYNVEFTIQETNCDNTTDLADIAKCEKMSCEFAVSVTRLSSSRDIAKAVDDQ